MSFLLPFLRPLQLGVFPFRVAVMLLGGFGEVTELICHVESKLIAQLESRMRDVESASTPGEAMREVFLSPPVPPIRTPEQIDSQNTFHVENLLQREFALLPSLGMLFRTSDTHGKSSSS